MLPISFALNLNIHQPSENLEHLLLEEPTEASQILKALDRIPRALWPYEKTARLHLSLSGTLLETLSDTDFQARTYDIMKSGDLLWFLQNNKIFELLATAYYHPVLPIIPEEDWEAQVRRWQGLGWHLFYKSHFSGFWPPELAVSMEMIPLLKQLGFRYMVVDSENIIRPQGMADEELLYKPHIARYGGEEIIVIVRDRELSNHLELGVHADDFIDLVQEKTQHCDFHPLVTAACNGDNGDTFRSSSHHGNFWNVLYQPLMKRVEANSTRIRPVFVTEYLDRFTPHGQITFKAGTWSTTENCRGPFAKWIDNDGQQQAIQRVFRTSQKVHQLRSEDRAIRRNPEMLKSLNEAYWHILRSETSCNFFWGDAWLNRCHADLNCAEHFIEHLSGANKAVAS